MNSFNSLSSSTKGEIIEPSDNDVVFGRGRGHMKRKGNIRFRTMMKRYHEEYYASECKSKLVWKIYKMIKSQGVRFLRHDKSTNTFTEVQQALAFDKVQDFLHKKPKPTKIVKISKKIPNNMSKIEELLALQRQIFYELLAKESPFLPSKDPFEELKTTSIPHNVSKKCPHLPTEDTFKEMKTISIPQNVTSEPFTPMDEDGVDDENICEEFEETVPYRYSENWV